jgi:integrase
MLLLEYTGLRWGEAISLRIGDLDMLRRRASISENAVQYGTEIYVGTPKAHKCRTVPLPEFLLTYLARQCEGRERDDLLFPGDDGKHLRRAHPTSGRFAKAVAASGIPRATPHDLRHTAASLAVSAGANVKAVQKMLGHAAATMTLDITPTSSTTTWRPLLARWTRRGPEKIVGKCGDRALRRPHEGLLARCSEPDE